MWQRLVDVLFPPQCIGCGAHDAYVCRACLNSRRRCEKSVWSAAENEIIRALYRYHDPIVKEALWLLKYKAIKDIAALFADKLLDEIEDVLPQRADEETTFLVPIPATRASARRRGYNQSLLLAEALAATESRMRVAADVLKRRRHVKRQTELKTRRERIANMENAFYVSEEQAVAGKRVIVVDDVTTTGATLNEAMRVLREAGTINVCALAVARQELKK